MPPAEEGVAVFDALIVDGSIRAIGVAERQLPDLAARGIEFLDGTGLACLALGGGRAAHLLEDAVLDLVTDLAVLIGGGLEALDEILVAETLVEGNESDPLGLGQLVEAGLHFRPGVLVSTD